MNSPALRPLDAPLAHTEPTPERQHAKRQWSYDTLLAALTVAHVQAKTRAGADTQAA